MADEVQGETPNPAPNGETPEAPVTADPAKLAADLESARKALKEANREAAERRKKLDAYEKAEADRKQAEMTELEKAQAALKAAQDKAARLERESLQRQAAEAAGLPAALAARLQGDTLEALTEDAKGLLDAMPKAEKPAPKLSPGNPGPGAGTQETLEQKKARLLGTRVDPFSEQLMRDKGGGVFFKE